MLRLHRRCSAAPAAAATLRRALHACPARRVDLRDSARSTIMLLPQLEAALGTAQLIQLEHGWALDAAEARTQQELAQAGLEERSQLFACTSAEMHAGLLHPEALPPTSVDGPDTGDRFIGWLPPPPPAPADYPFFFGPPADRPELEAEPPSDATSLGDLDYPYGAPGSSCNVAAATGQMAEPPSTVVPETAGGGAGRSVEH